jgi:leucyl/phenylalanyl-tRNA--protein transferase
MKTERDRFEPFTADDLIECYRRGVFPMADARSDRRLFLVDPAIRGVIPLNAFHVPGRLARRVRSERFAIRLDSAFEAVIEACAASRADRLETWINRPIQGLCVELFGRGLAHSVEAWREGRLVGGLYGVAIGGAFFGESMFHSESDASKVALTHLVARLLVGGFRLLDTQFVTSHLQGFGAVEVSRARYAALLAEALEAPANFGRLSPYAAGTAALQAISHAS